MPIYKAMRLILALTILLSTPLHAAEPPAAAAEIQHLLSYLATSGCAFYRNGDWYEAAAARAHLEKKYQYLLKKDLINRAEDFIARAATASSLSGEAYQVRCGEQATNSAAWLMAELIRLRQTKAADH